MTNALAHTTPDGREHLLSEHLAEVGRIAGVFADVWGAKAYAERAGLLHDLGKYAADFQRYIRDVNAGSVERSEAHIEVETTGASVGKRVDHSSAGAVFASAGLGPMGMAVAFTIAGHHAGLANRSDLRARLDRKRDRLEAARIGAPAALLTPSTLEIPPALRLPGADLEAPVRRLELWTRMLFSALCDADFLDTEAFFGQVDPGAREVARGPGLDVLLGRLTGHVDAMQAAAPATSVNAVRREIRCAAVEAAALTPGVFTLTVPTGGGKTLAGMEFALHHARTHGLERVIVAIPYTSILEQSADVYRRAFDDSEVVLEHHSNFDPRRETNRSRLAAQNWDAPIIVTTTVQLFESLFASRTSRCRKLHNLARSVIVLDEAQTMPPGLLAPTLEVLGDLVRDYGASLVISTATQPALGRESLPDLGLAGSREIVPASLDTLERLRRVEVQWPTALDRATPYPELADALSREREVLAITHLRKDARELTELLDARLGHRETRHLSALMCAEHRSEVLASIKASRLAGTELRVVSTQLVEAGVDLDFPVVYRALGGLDALAQAAGRCNREGRLERGQLRVFMAPTRPPMGVPRRALEITLGLLRAAPSLDLFAPETFRAYFERLYSTASTDSKAIQVSRAKLNFEDVARDYRMIEDDWSAPIIVRFGRAAALLDQLQREGPSRRLLRALGRFSVNAPAKLVEQWVRSGHALRDAESDLVVLAPYVDAYDTRFGLVPERVTSSADAGTLIVDG